MYTNTVALVTGGSRGIGAATAHELARLGYTVAVNYIKEEASAHRIADNIISLGGSAKCYRADISSPSEVRYMFDAIENDLGSVDLLVNNAGIAHIGLLQDMTDDDIARQVGVNLLGAVYCSRRAIPSMVRNKSGAIINIASMWGEVGASCEAMYSACKAGIIGLTKSLAKELGPSGIRVNCISPGVIDTDMNGELDYECIKALENDTPLMRIGTANDVAKAIAFLASDDASFITGQILPVNGGIIC